jgi:hypothetical protein
MTREEVLITTYQIILMEIEKAMNNYNVVTREMYDKIVSDLLDVEEEVVDLHIVAANQNSYIKCIK